jgi:hypothetical protein
MDEFPCGGRLLDTFRLFQQNHLLADITLRQSSHQPIWAHRLILSSGASLFRAISLDESVLLFGDRVLFDLERQISVLGASRCRRFLDPVNNASEAVAELCAVHLDGFLWSQDKHRV